MRTPVVKVAASTAWASAPANPFAPPALAREGTPDPQRSQRARALRASGAPNPTAGREVSAASAAPRACQQRLHGRDRRLLALGDLTVAASFEGVTDKGLALAFRKLMHRAHQPADPLALLHRRRHGLIGGAVLPLHDLLRRPRAPNGVDGRVAHDREQPRPRVLGAGAGGDHPVSTEEGLLDDILGEARVLAQLAHGESRQLAAMEPDECLEHVLPWSSAARGRRVLLRTHRTPFQDQAPLQGFSDGLDVGGRKMLRSVEWTLDNMG